ncbi:MAG: hypothetical protein QOJ52_58 [Acidimicrobiaceae bacterium]|nr:hypothetical protein [Acidimicrobiaceae bacterium]
MPRRRLRSTLTRVTRIGRRPRSTASLAAAATVGGLTGLALVALVAASVVLAAFASAYLAGLVLGAGLVVTGWVLTSTQRLGQRRTRVPGRSRTMDCRQSRWGPRPTTTGQPHPPTEAQRRVRPCPGTRHR